MTLDPVHVDGIARLASQVGAAVDETDHDDVVETAWTDFMDPLRDGGEAVLEPIDGLARRKVAVDDAALQELPFPTQHGLDAGTINPTTFNNGLVLDVAQAAMAAVPSDIELHRSRTIVMTVHANDRTVDLATDWQIDDRGYARQRRLHAPQVDRYEQTVVHALALYLAESEHAIQQAETVSDLLVLDGPIYPTGLLKWQDRDPELRRLLTSADLPRQVVGNYIDLVETFVERGVPLVGFVKNSASKAITQVLRDTLGAPWVDDEAFFRRLLARRDGDGELRTDALTFTNWFRSRVGTHGLIADPERLAVDRHRGRGGETGGKTGTEGSLDPADFEVTFMVVYDPRDDLVYRVEAPYAVTRDDETRAALTDQVLAAVAAERGPPAAVGKADSLARISRKGKEALRERIEREFDTRRQRSYDDRRWGVTDGME